MQPLTLVHTPIQQVHPKLIQATLRRFSHEGFFFLSHVVAVDIENELCGPKEK